MCVQYCFWLILYCIQLCLCLEAVFEIKGQLHRQLHWEELTGMENRVGFSEIPFSAEQEF